MTDTMKLKLFMRYVEEAVCQNLEAAVLEGKEVEPIIFLLGKEDVFFSTVDGRADKAQRLVKGIQAARENETIIAGAFAAIVKFASIPRHMIDKLTDTDINNFQSVTMITFKMNGVNHVYAYQSVRQNNGSFKFYIKLQIDILQDYTHVFDGLFEKQMLH